MVPLSFLPGTGLCLSPLFYFYEILKSFAEVRFTQRGATKTREVAKRLSQVPSSHLIPTQWTGATPRFYFSSHQGLVI